MKEFRYSEFFKDFFVYFSSTTHLPFTEAFVKKQVENYWGFFCCFVVVLLLFFTFSIVWTRQVCELPELFLSVYTLKSKES